MRVMLGENPLLISIMIGVVVMALLYAWLQSGNGKIALGAVAVAMLIPGAFYVAGAIVTDREKILQAIDATADAVEKNDHENAVRFIADRATRQRALKELPSYDFSRISVRNVKIVMVDGSYPQEASVDLDASVTVSRVTGGMKNVRVPRRVILTFQKQDDGSWGVTDYTHMPLTGGPDNFSPNRIQ